MTGNAHAHDLQLFVREVMKIFHLHTGKTNDILVEVERREPLLDG